MKLIIAEKKELALDIAGAICGVTVSESTRLPVEGNGYKVVACAGHLLELQEPALVDPKWDKPWNLESLPIAPDSWPKVAVEDKIHLLKTIEKGLCECDGVIHAGDPDDEGQLIVDEVLEHFGYEGKVERVYVNDNIEKNIRKAFSELVINDVSCKRAGLAALARQLGDASFGYSNSRLVSLKVKRAMTQGRVQTPVMVAVVNRDLAHEGHAKTFYYEATAMCMINGITYPFKFKPNKETLNGEKHLLSSDIADAIKASLEGSSKEVITSVTEKKTRPPLPYNLTDLLSDMNRRYKIKASKTQEISQRLRAPEIKAITYNRTDSSYLKEAHFEEGSARLSCAFKNLSKSWDIDYSIKSEAFDDSLAPNHHGIIPQESIFEISVLTDDELKVYEAIVERFAMQFSPPEVYDQSLSIIEIDQGTLEYKAKNITDPGFKAIFNNTFDEDGQELSEDWLAQGSHRAVIGEVKVDVKETKPPKRYTEGALLKDMASFAKYATDPEIKKILQAKDKGKKNEHGGIGTPATRTSIIEGLKKRGYLREDGDYLTSTPLAREYVKILPEEMKTPELTARWWIIQQDVTEGKVPVTAIQDDVVRVFNEIKDTAYEGIDLSGSASTAPVLGTCPQCGKNVLGKEKSITCESNKYKKIDDAFEQTEGCGFRLPRVIKGKKLTDNQVKALLAKKKTPEIAGFKSKEGKAFSAHLVLKPDSGIGFEFAKKGTKAGKKKL